MRLWKRSILMRSFIVPHGLLWMQQKSLKILRKVRAVNVDGTRFIAEVCKSLGLRCSISVPIMF